MTQPSEGDFGQEHEPNVDSHSSQPKDSLGRGFYESALGAQSKVVEEHGRWVVYLSVDFWEPSAGGHPDGTQCDEDSWPVTTYWKRISDYPDRGSAEVAAGWIERSAARNLPHPPTGF